MFNTKLIKFDIFTLPTPAQAPFAVNFVHLNRNSSIWHFLKLCFFFVFESLKHLFLNVGFFEKSLVLEFLGQISPKLALNKVFQVLLKIDV